ncbi:MAG: 30S ribosomal protein S1 [Planctomycetaceae bacterium]|nr:30S ribosomal protein S1 [Planctomycetaceae bacterium]
MNPDQQTSTVSDQESTETGSVETAANETPEATAPETESPATSNVESSEARPKVALNPSTDAGQLRPVPTQIVAASSEAPQPTQEVEIVAGVAVPVGPPQRSGPAEIPRAKDVALDADLEDEINAMLASDEAKAANILADPEGEESTDASADEPPPRGTRMKVQVQSIHGDDVFVDLGFREPGVLQLRQFTTDKQPQVGQEIDIVVGKYNKADGLITVNLPTGKQSVGGNWDSIVSGDVVDVMVSKANKGGLEVSVGGLRGFLPAGQIDTRYVENLEPYVGQKLTVQITEVNRKRRNIVVSRRAFLEEQRKEAEAHIWSTLQEGAELPGKVKTIKDYGAFIDLGGIDGFLHIGEISWLRINHPSEVIQEGQDVQVKVLKLDGEQKKISLGMKQLTQHPWATAMENFQVGAQVTGKVTRIMDYGAFVELQSGVEGMVHISELEYRRIKRVEDVLSIGQTVDVKVLDIDEGRRRIALSVKALKERPKSEKDEKPPSDEDLAPSAGEAYVRKRKGPLKGGTGNTGGGLFGNPDDFS